MQAFKRKEELQKSKELEYIRPADRNGRQTSDAVSTEALEAAQWDYREACERARIAVRQQLQQLAETLQVSKQSTTSCTRLRLHGSGIHAHLEGKMK